MLRSRGVVVGTLASLFGEDAARDLQSLVSTLENVAAAVAQEPERVFTLMARLAKIEGASLNLRGIIIEMFVAHLYKLEGYSIEIRQLARDDQGNQAEIDVRATSRQEVVCCECKGKASGVLVTDVEINDWLTRSLPRIKEWLKRIPSAPEAVRFEFFSSTGYTQEAEKIIQVEEAKHKRQPIKFYRGEEIVRRLQKHKESSLVEVFREQFQRR